jgi:hypothetical protein
MNQDLLNRIIEQRNLLVPSLFTDTQINVIQKYLHHDHLNGTEKAYFYSAIKRKLDALNALQEEFYIHGEGMIPERVEQAKEILQKLKPKKAFISGSFLYKKDYEDVDIYVISRKRKSYHKDNQHFIFISEKMLRDPIFYSSWEYSVANFHREMRPDIKRADFNEILFIYQWVINQILDNEDQKEIRDLLFQYYLQIKKEIPHSYSLYQKVEEIKSLPVPERINRINQLTKEILLGSYSKRYLYLKSARFLKELKKDLTELKVHDNITIYCKMLKEVKDECRRA